MPKSLFGPLDTAMPALHKLWAFHWLNQWITSLFLKQLELNIVAIATKGPNWYNHTYFVDL